MLEARPTVDKPPVTKPVATAERAVGDEAETTPAAGGSAPTPAKADRAKVFAVGSLDGRIGEGLVAGALTGATMLAIFFAAELVAGARLSMMGVHDEELQRTLLGRFGRYIFRQQVEVFFAYLFVGGALGGAAALGLSLWELGRARSRSLARRAALVACATTAVLGWRLAVTIIRYPQLYVDSLYARGGIPRAMQLFLTERVPQSLVVWGGWGLCAMFFLLPLAGRSGRALLVAAVRAEVDAVRARPRRALKLGAGVVAVGLGLVILLQRSTPAGALGPSRPASSPGSANGGGPANPEQKTTGIAANRSAAGQRPNILILAVDSLRADRVGPDHARVAPNLAALSERGVRFEAAHVSIPRTFPSWTTILSGRFPPHHGLRHMFPPASTRAAVGPLLPARLAAAGYHTAVVSDFSGEIFSRLPAGFEERRVPFFDMKVVLAQAGWNLHPTLFPFVASALGHRVFPALAAAAENADPDRLADTVIDTIHSAAGKAPFLVTAFFSAPHFPYAAPDPYYRRFTDSAYRGPFRYHKPVAAFAASDGSLSAADVDQIRGLYDGAVAAVDAAVGRILAALAAEKLDGNTIVVVLADHGENLFDEGRGMGHGEHLQGDAALHIPLVIYDPVHHFPAHAPAGLVRDVDIAPTLASLAGIPIEESDGVDLEPVLRGDKDTLDLVAFAESELWLVAQGAGFGPDERLPYPALPTLVTVAADDDIVINPAYEEIARVARHRAVRTDRWKLLYVPTRDGVRLSLFDVQADPDEQHDVSARYPAVLADLRARLYEYLQMDGSRVQAGYAVPER